MHRFRAISLLAGGLLAAGCGGVSSDLFDSGAGAEDAASVDAPPSGDASSSVDGDPSPVDATAPKDAAPDVPVGPADSLIRCGPQLGCSAQNQVCCWHTGSTSKPYECVSDVSACSGMDDVPMTCSSSDNCASQGQAGYQCCATTAGNYGTGACYTYELASVVSCKASCDVLDYELGCSIKNQDCSDGISTCVVSKCTVPGVTMCY